LQKLAFPEMDARFRRIDLPSSNTCQWLSELDTYRQWCTKEHSLIWLKGKAGAGKSVLVKYTARSYRVSSTQNSDIVAAYFYDAGGCELERSSVGALRSILYQIFRKNPVLLSEYLSAPADDNVLFEQSQSFALEELFEIFNSVVRQMTWKPVVIFIDALDEGDETDVRQLLRYFERLLHDLAKTDKRKLSILLSSRHYPNITLRGCPEIWVEHHNAVDIARHIQQNLHLVTDSASTLPQILIEKASGVFLWVNVMIEMLAKAGDRGETMARKHEILREAPPQLEELFIQLLARLTAREKKETFQITKWIAFAARPLTPMELCFALSLDDGSPFCSMSSWKRSDRYIQSDQQMQHFIRSRSRGLLEITKGSQTESSKNVRFIHESVAEFMVRRGLILLESSLLNDVSGVCHDQIWGSCLNYLQSGELEWAKQPSTEEMQYVMSYDLMDDDTTGVDADHLAISWEAEPLRWAMQSSACWLDQFPFLAYAVEFLFYHIEIAERARVHQAGLTKYLSVHGMSTMQRWKFLQSRLSPTSAYLDVDWDDYLQITAARGLLSCVVAIVGRFPTRGNQLSDISSKFDKHKALFWAVSFGHLEVVRTLLDAAADTNIHVDRGKTTFHLVCEKSTHHQVREFLQYGGDIRSVDYSGWTCLHWAVQGERSDQVAVIQELLRAGAHIEAQNKAGETPLFMAARLHRVDATQVLISRKADVDAPDFFDRSPLFIAGKFRFQPNSSAYHEVAILLSSAGAKSIGEDEAIDRSMTASPAPDGFSHRKKVREPEAGTSEDGRLVALLGTTVDQLSYATQLTVKRRQERSRCIYCGSCYHSQYDQCSTYEHDLFYKQIRPQSNLAQRTASMAYLSPPTMYVPGSGDSAAKVPQEVLERLQALRR
jgi:hypothetical protein